jgi:hypothetical protein
MQKNAKPRRSPRRAVGAPVACAAVLALLALAGCGSSKPAYCSARANLENSVKGLTSLNASSGISGLQAQLTKIQSDANSVVSSAKGDFPNETSAIQSSLSALEASARAVASNPSAGAIATVASDASKFVNSVTTFTNATKSKCS